LVPPIGTMPGCVAIGGNVQLVEHRPWQRSNLDLIAEKRLAGGTRRGWTLRCISPVSSRGIEASGVGSGSRADFVIRGADPRFVSTSGGEGGFHRHGWRRGARRSGLGPGTRLWAMGG